ncbi:MAG: hypothetical protein NVS1B7_7330 [Candidatus Saccharimonadales bacterium]
MARHSSAQTFSQSYGSDKPLQRGLIVKLKKNDTTKVEPVTLDTATQTFGVTIGATDAAVTLSSTNAPNYVATNGHYDVLVNTQNGRITPGEYITISAIEGIGMRAGTDNQIVIGRALAGFDGKTGVVSTTDVVDSNKHNQTIAIGRISVDIGVAKNPLLKATQTNVPEFLKKASESIAGKPVSAVRAYVSLVVFIAGTAIAAALMYGGVRSGITSIGRNPLSKKSIIRSMLQVILTGLIIFITGIFGVYLLLKI